MQDEDTMDKARNREADLLTAANRALIKRAVKGSIFYPLVMAVLVCATDWLTVRPGLGLGLVLTCAIAGAVRFTYFRHLHRHPESWVEDGPRHLPLVLLTPTLTYGVFAALSLTLFGLTSITSVLVVFTVLGFAAGGTSSLAMRRRVHLAFVLTLVVPPAVAAVASGSGEGITVAVLFALNVVFMAKEGKAAHESFVELFDKNFELGRAFGELEIKRDQLVERNAQMTRVLDNIEQGLCAVGLDGRIQADASAAFEQWFGPASTGTPFATHVGDPEFAEWFDLSMELLGDGMMPPEVALEQFPAILHTNGRILSLTYRPIEQDAELEGLLVVISDITEKVEHENAEREQRELVTLFQLLARDPEGFREFRSSADAIVRQLTEGGLPRREQLRALHTLKGNAAVMGVHSIAKLCHAIEEEAIQNADPLDPDQCAQLTEAWTETHLRMATILGDRGNVVELSFEEHEQLLAMIAAGAHGPALAAIVRDWRLESIPNRFRRMASQARRTARSVGKELRIELDVPPLRLDPECWRDLWAVCVHLMRNSVDHAIEDRETRLAQHKPAAGLLHLSARCEDDELVVRVRDDGRGIDWDKVRQRASDLCLPLDTASELQEALFWDGLSTKEEVTELSGRGVGLGAVVHEVDRRGGHVEVHSDPGVGTTFTIRVPLKAGDSVAA